MPGIQGKEVAKRVCELQPGIGVLYMSGYTEGLLSAQGVLESGITLIEKPFTEASLLKKTARDTARARDGKLNRPVLDRYAIFSQTETWAVLSLVKGSRFQLLCSAGTSISMN